MYKRWPKTKRLVTHLTGLRNTAYCFLYWSGLPWLKYFDTTKKYLSMKKFLTYKKNRNIYLATAVDYYILTTSSKQNKIRKSKSFESW